MSVLRDVLRNSLFLVITPQCYDKYFNEFDFSDGPCFSKTLGNCLGLAIILSPLLFQIVKIYRNKSGKGISLLSVTLDLTFITVYACYSFLNEFPWEVPLLTIIHTVTIAVLVLYYRGPILHASLYLLGYLCVIFVLISGLTPIGILWTLQRYNILILVSGKLTQAYTNYKNGSTGQLSSATLIMLFMITLMRFFRTIQETGDTMVILTYIAATMADGILVLQLIYYWNAVIPEKIKQL